jgi:hypothetical protein
MDKIKQLLNQSINHLQELLQRVQQHLHHQEPTVENNNVPQLYTEEQLMARLKFFIGICLSLTLFGIVFVVLYSLIFVTQPLNAISPIDQKFFELIIPIATFLTGTLSGIMLAGGDKDAQKQALAAANKGWDKPPSPTGGSSNGGFNSSSGGFTTPGPSSTGFGTTTGGFGSSAPTTSGFGGSGFGSASSAATTGFGSNTGFGAPATPAVTASGKAIVPDMPQPEL